MADGVRRIQHKLDTVMLPLVELRGAAMKPHDESGAVLVLSVVVLVVLLGFTALVIDLGIAHSHRRSMQAAADAAALGAAQNLAGSNPSNASTTATALGDENLPGRTIAWNACAGDTLPSGFQIADASHNAMHQPAGPEIEPPETKLA